MKHAIVHDPATLGARAIIVLRLKMAAVVVLLTAILAFPALTQQLGVRRVNVVQMPLLRESNPVAIMALEANRARGDRMSTTIHFDVGSSAIRPDAIAALEAKLDLLRGSPALRIRIEGRADVRGSSADNITLAWSRAEAAKLWLTTRGIASDRIEAVGFSAWRPICEAPYESCSRQSRRAEFVIVAGADLDVEERQ